MYLHLGNGISVRTREILAIQDVGVFAKGAGKECFEKYKREKKVVRALEDEDQEEKSLVLTEDCVYISAISPLTLKRRAEKAELR